MNYLGQNEVYFLSVGHSIGRILSFNGPLHFAKRLSGNIHSFIFLLAY